MDNDVGEDKQEIIAAFERTASSLLCEPIEFVVAKALHIVRIIVIPVVFAIDGKIRKLFLKIEAETEAKRPLADIVSEQKAIISGEPFERDIEMVIYFRLVEGIDGADL